MPFLVVGRRFGPIAVVLLVVTAGCAGKSSAQDALGEAPGVDPSPAGVPPAPPPASGIPSGEPVPPAVPPNSSRPPEAEPQPARPLASVVVATFDSGANPFHPCWRWKATANPKEVVPYLPNVTKLPLTLGTDYDSSLQASQAVIDGIQDGVLYYIPGTRLLFYGLEGASSQLIDATDHGSQASSQIACKDYAFGDNAYVVIINGMNERTKDALLYWAADQQWIDVVHYNFQSGAPTQSAPPDHRAEAARAPILAGKSAVYPAGNGIAGMWVVYPQETSRITGPPGSLVIGACDEDGWTLYSNLHPHVCPDGGDTLSGASYGFGADTFEGTSSSSPRAAGFVAEMLARLRHEFNTTGGMSDGKLVTLGPRASAPSQGPLADGTLTAEELHLVIRRTADPLLLRDALDGNESSFYQAAVHGNYTSYAKGGYGKLTLATFDAALEVLLGREPLPARPQEDYWYEYSEQLRETRWGYS